MKQLMTVVTFILSFINMSCNKDDNTVNQQNNLNVVMALKVGNVSAYRYSSYDSAGIVQFTDTLVYTIVRDTLINSERWYFVGSESYAIELLTNRSDGLWYMRLSDQSNGILEHAPILMIKYPSIINESWPSIDSNYAKYIAADVPINVPLGKFTCNQYAFTGKGSNTFTQNIYFPVGKSYARSERIEKLPSGSSFVSYRFDLINLTLQKQSIYVQRSKNYKLLFIAG